MPHVSGHYRNGRWVRPHYRRNTPHAVRGTGVVRVRAHRRSDGTLVRSYYRSVDPAPAPVSSSAGSDWDWLWYVVLAVAVLALLGAIGAA